MDYLWAGWVWRDISSVILKFLNWLRSKINCDMRLLVGLFYLKERDVEARLVKNGEFHNSLMLSIIKDTKCDRRRYGRQNAVHSYPLGMN